MQPVFDALGMGDSMPWEHKTVVPEQAWCMDEIVEPDDADVISWDYG